MSNRADCKFCTLTESAEAAHYGSVVVIPDGYPVTPGHVLIIPSAHRETYFDLTDAERTDTHVALTHIVDGLDAEGASGYNIGWNCGQAAGQTIMHAHCHLIPRSEGDVDDPTGGVRGVIPAKQHYTRKAK